MTNNNIDEFDVEDIDDYTALSNEEMQKLIPSFTSDKLCSVIVCNRYFGSFKDMAVMCMEELAKRRVAGDDFDFESFIDNKLNSLPKLDFKIPDLGDVLRNFAIGRAK